MTARDFYFEFQNDDGAVCRFIKQQPSEKFVFDKTVYMKVGHDLEASIDPDGIAVKGGQVSIFSEGLLTSHPITFVSSQLLTGEDFLRFIGRLFCPGSGEIIHPTRHILGSVGIMRIRRTGNRTMLEQIGPVAKWVQKVEITEGYLRDDSIFGLEYDPVHRVLKVYSFGSLRENRSISTELTIPTEEGDNLFLAIELTAKADQPQTLLTIRECNSEVWAKFLDFHPISDPDEAATPLEAMDMVVAEEREDGRRHQPIHRRINDLRARRTEEIFRMRNPQAQPINADLAGDDDVVEIGMNVAEEEIFAEERVAEENFWANELMRDP